MTDGDRRLLAAIEALAIDPPDAQLTFVDRLARENGWSRDHAAAVDREYRRFLFLAATGDAPVTPSDAVDQAWHLHLAYTRSYWDDLCGRVLGRPLHHGPTEGGAAERARYRDQYAATLARYAAVFGQAPPAIWPSVDERFRGRFLRVDRDRAWVIDTGVLSRGRTPILAGGLVVGGVAALIGFGWVECIVVTVIGWIFAALSIHEQRDPERHRRKRREDDGCGFDVGDGDGDGCGGCGGD